MTMERGPGRRRSALPGERLAKLARKDGRGGRNAAVPRESKELEEDLPMLAWSRIIDFVEEDPVAALSAARSCEFFRSVFSRRADRPPSPGAEASVRNELRPFVSEALASMPNEWDRSSPWKSRHADNMWSLIAVDILASVRRKEEEGSEAPLDEFVASIKSTIASSREKWMFAPWSRIALFARSLRTAFKKDFDASCCACGAELKYDHTRFTNDGMPLPGKRRPFSLHPVAGEVSIAGTASSFSISACSKCLGKEVSAREISAPGLPPGVTVFAKRWFKEISRSKPGQPNGSCLGDVRSVRSDDADARSSSDAEIVHKILWGITSFTGSLRGLRFAFEAHHLCEDLIDEIDGRFRQMALAGLERHRSNPVEKIKFVAGACERARMFDNKIVMFVSLAESRLSLLDAFRLGKRRPRPWDATSVIGSDEWNAEQHERTMSDLRRAATDDASLWCTGAHRTEAVTAFLAGVMSDDKSVMNASLDTISRHGLMVAFVDRLTHRNTEPVR